MVWANCFAAKNRISGRNLGEEDGPQTALQVWDQTLPGEEDYDLQRLHFTEHTKRILVSNIPHFKDHYNDCIQPHIIHEKSKQSKEKSDIWNLGVIEENPGAIDGSVRICEWLSKYVPRTTEGNVFPILVNGDGGSVEQIVKAKRLRSAEFTPLERLQGIEPVPGEFHKRGILLQDLMNTMFSQKSAADRGTLYHCKQIRSIRSLRKEVMQNFHHVEETVHTAVHGNICLLAMEILELSSLDEDPANSPFSGPFEDRDAYLTSIARRIVEQIWQPMPSEGLDEAKYAKPDWNEDPEKDLLEESDFPDQDVYCICKAEDKTTQLMCSNGDHCQNGKWFHLECVGMPELPPSDDDWWCSDVCKAEKRSVYCRCKTYNPKLSTVVCGARDDCAEGEVFHLSCVGLRRKPRKPWYCSERCRKIIELSSKLPETDNVKEYHLELTYQGLCDIVRKDAIRENNGRALLAFWRIDMLQFWDRRHTKYLTIGTRLLSGIAGWYPGRIKHEATWNRTVNIHGGQGRNIAVDLMNEFLNLDFKESAKHARGMLTPTEVSRASQLGGSFARHVDAMFSRNIAGTYVHRSSVQPNANPPYVAAYVREYCKDRFFHDQPGRSYKGFPNFTRKSGVLKNPMKLATTLMKTAFKIDRFRKILPE